ncbi:GNAT family N-acetyltransferase [Mucilaginibacter arboris]|uniref:GNAT family N-acetyltransferase n=1 Tax=Mucilaginibacter arboris TaxID=2682090 RepID=A0A7K1SV18_9SPHI|nr:GNAT family N-acetyltransferase [Mucilaginibacter arboris]MVN21171.1 GNAT family N-acetyltransferase [Mucilaginibacter arboris]
MNPEITIQKVQPEEAAQFAKFSADLFSETFAEFNDPKDMENYLAEAFNINKIEEELTNPHTYCFYASKNSMPIGGIKFIVDTADASFTGIKSAEISRLYVAKAYHNQKIGAMLMQYAIDWALQNKTEKLWLGVWEKNQKAIDFYLQWGFTKTGIVDFKLGNDLQQDWLMEKQLR